MPLVSALARNMASVFLMTNHGDTFLAKSTFCKVYDCILWYKTFKINVICTRSTKDNGTKIANPIQNTRAKCFS
jgi:hypothetical protein